jgi:hypothetical protein
MNQTHINEAGNTLTKAENSPFNRSNLGQDGKKPGETDAQLSQSRLDKVKAMLPSGTTILMGLSVVGLTSYAGAAVDATDGVQADILSITIVSNSASEGTLITIAYTPPNALFNPCAKDSIDLSPDIPVFGGKSGLEVVSAPTNNSIQVKCPDVNIKMFPQISSQSASSSKPSWGPGGKFTDHTSLANQFTDSTVAVATVLAVSAVGVADAGVSAAADVAGNTVKEVGGTFCKTAPILCNWKLWVGIGILIVMGLILSLAGKKS